MRNKITDLNNHLFAQLERLGDEDLTPEQLEQEIKRSKSIADISKTIVESNRVAVEAMRVIEKAGGNIDALGNNLLASGTSNHE